MSNVDERIVRMEFDNSNFEAGATKATEILKKLDDSLKFDDAASGLDTVQKSISKFNLDGVQNALVESESHFSAFQEFSIGVFRSLGEEAVRFAKNITGSLVQSLTRGAKDGFDEYQLLMNSLQTISANSGESMDVIKTHLDELNEYADKTIYVFSDMTANIGRFTAAGLDVTTSTNAIKGFSNMAALAGAATQEASRGMYQLSQAMAAGVVKLQDWKSIQNASIDTAAFKDILIETSRAMKTGADAAIEKQGSFTASLSEGWLTADVMAQALEVATMSTRDFANEEDGLNQRMKEMSEMGYSEDVARKLIEIANNADDSAREMRTWKQLIEAIEESIGSGWATTWELIIGDFDEATELFSGLGKRFDGIIGGIADARNAMFADWKKAGGREGLLGILDNLFEAITRIVVPIKDAFSSVFGVSGKQLAVFTENIAWFTQRLVISEDTMTAITAGFTDILTIIHSLIGVAGNLVRIAVNAITAIWSVVSPIIRVAGSIISGVVFVVAKASVLIHSLSDKLVVGVQRTLAPISSILGGILNSVVDIFFRMLKPIRRGFIEISKLFGRFVKALKSLFAESQTFKILKNWGDTIKKFVKGVQAPGKIFGHTIAWFFIHPFKLLKDALVGFNKDHKVRFFKEWVRGLVSLIDGPLSSALSLGESLFKSLLDFITGPVADGFGKVIEWLSGISISNPFSGIADWFSGLDIFSNIPFFDDISGFSDSITGLSDKVKEFAGTSEEYSQALQKTSKNTKAVSPKNTKKQLTMFQKVSATVKGFAGKILPSLQKGVGKAGEVISSTFNKVVSYFKNLNPQKLASDLGGIFDKIVSKVTEFSPKIGGFFGNIAEFFKEKLFSLTDGAVNFQEVFEKMFAPISDKLENLPEPIKSLFQRIADTFSWGKTQIENEAGKLSFDNIGTNLSNLGTNVGTALSSFVDGILNVPDMLGNIFDDVVAKAQEFIGQFPSLDKIGDASELVLQGGLIASLIQFTQSFKNVNKSFSGMADSIKKWPTAFENGMKSFGQQFGKYESKADAILKVAGAIALLAGALFLLASIPEGDLIKAGKAMGALAVGLLGLFAVFEALEKAKFFNPALLVAVGSAFSGVAIGVLALAFAALILSNIPEDQLQTGISAITQLMACLALYAFALRSNGPSLLAGSIAMVIFAGALNLMVGVVEKLGGIKKKKLDKGVHAFIGIMLGLSIFGAVGAKGIGVLLGSFMKFGIGIALFSASLVILAASIKLLDDALSNLKDVSAVLVTVIGFMVAFMLATLMLKNADPMSVGIALIAFSVAIGIMALAMSGLANIDMTNAAAGMLVLLAMIAEFAIVANLVDSGKLVSAAVSLIYFGAALLIMAGACKVLASIGDQMDSVIVGLSFMMGLLLEFGLIAGLVGPDSLISAGQGILMFSVAVIAMAAAFKILETVNIQALIGPLIAVVATFAIFAAGAALLGPATAFLIPAAVAMTILAGAVLLLAAAFWIFSDGLDNLNKVGPEKTAELMASFGEGLGSILDQLIARLPDLIGALVTGLINGAGQLVTAAVSLIEQFGQFCMENSSSLLIAGGELLAKLGEGIAGAVGFVAEKAPDVINALVTNFGPFMSNLINAGKDILSWLGQGLAEFGPEILNWGSDVVSGLVNGVKEEIPKLAQAGLEVAQGFIQSVKNFFGIASPSTVMADVGGNLVQGLINGIGDFLGSLGTKALEIGSTILNAVAGLPGTLWTKGSEAVGGFITGVGSVAGGVVDKGSELASGLVSGAKNLYTDLKTKASDGVSGFVQGAGSKISDVSSKSKEISTKMVAGLSNLKTNLKRKATDGMNAFVQGINGKLSAVKSAASNIASSASKGIGSLYSKFKSIGSNAGSGFIDGIGSMISSAASKAASLAKAAADAAKQKLKIKSPSRVFREIGAYTGEGFIQGIDSGTSGVVGASKSLAGSVIDSFADALSMAAMSSDDLLDFDDPVITPVLDTSDIDYSMDRLRASMGMGFNDLSIGNLNYTGELSAKISDYNDLNKQTLDAIANNQLDYNLLGVAVANALIQSGVHVEMDGGQLMGYLAGEISDARRMYR